MGSFVAECWVIILILGIAGYMFARSKRKAWSAGVLPLMLVPLVNIIYAPIGRHVAAKTPEMAGIIRTIVYLLAFAAASCWILLFARKLPGGRPKLAYIISTIGFTAILILIFLIKIRL